MLCFGLRGEALRCEVAIRNSGTVTEVHNGTVTAM